MGFWHTGYMEFHEPTGIDVYYPPAKIWYPCQKCDLRFESVEELRRHRFEDHAYARPMLFVRGLEVGATPVRVTKPLATGDIHVDRASKATVNGKAVKLGDLSKHLAPILNDRVTVELTNDGASASFELNFEIASVEHLSGVEVAFFKLARNRTLSIAAIGSFIEECRGFGTAAGYFDGICHYLYGVLAKERAQDSGLRYDEYPERYSRAADQLKGFERSLSHTVQALVAFHFNHFDDACFLAPPGRLRHAALAFAASLEKEPWNFVRVPPEAESVHLENLLTDYDTVRILDWAALGVSELGGEAADIEARLNRDLPSFDRLKLQVMLAEGLAAHGNVTGARKAARELIGNPQTTAWAEWLLSRLPA
jgi:hypothetical protein